MLVVQHGPKTSKTGVLKLANGVSVCVCEMYHLRVYDNDHPNLCD